MTVTGCDPGVRNENGRTGSYGIGSSAAVAGPRNLHRVIPMNPNNQLPKNSTDPSDQKQGEHSMSFLKNLFTEEDGQDMVEYGLVIALVVLACVTGLGLYKTAIVNGFASLTTKVTSSLQ